MIGEQNNDEGYQVLSVKVSPDQATLLNTICDVLGVNSYQIFQMFFYTLMRASSPMHELSPEIQKIMTFMETDASWAEAFNIANPNDLRLARAILILEQKDKKGFGAVLIDKPTLPGEKPQMTECVDKILDSVFGVTMPGVHSRLRRIGKRLDRKQLSDVLLTMIDRLSDLLTEEENRFEMKGDAMYDARGRRIEYGKKSKRKKHFTPDTMPTVGSLFDDIDHSAQAPELEDWEGERVNRNLNEELSKGHIFDD